MARTSTTRERSIMLTDLGTTLAGLLALGIVLMGSRYLLAPKPAAAGFGIPGALGETASDRAWLAVKAARDIAIGIAIAALLIDGARQPLAYLMIATSLIPIAGGTIVLRVGGPRAIACGIHWTTAALMLTVAVLLIA
jgi:Domain of unknown function (DUF4267)